MEPSGRKFNEVYCKYMLFKTKIKCKAYSNADQILEDARKNLTGLRQLQNVLATYDEDEDGDNEDEYIKEVQNNFLMSEIAYTQLEAIKGIDEFIEERKNDEEWLARFVPASNSEDRTSNTYFQFYKNAVEDLKRAKFFLDAVKAQSTQVERIVNHDVIMKSMNILREPKHEINQVKHLLTSLKELTSKITQYKEENLVELPNYCSYFHI